MADKTISIGIEIDAKRSGAGAGQVVNNLRRIEEQANKTREKMEKVAQVGTTIGLGGGAILAPLMLAMKKYTDTVKDTEPVSKRITELSAKWEASQVRLGRIVATQVLPALEKGAGILEKVIAFAEANPGVVQAALTIGTTLVVLGGLIVTTANLVKTIATIQALAASVGIGGGAAGAATGAAGAAAGGAGLSAAIAAGFTAAIPALVGALALVIGGQIGLGLGNALAGTNQTWADIGETVRMLVVIVKEAWGRLFVSMGYWLQSLGRMIGDALKAVWEGIKSLFRGGKASGGYMARPGLYAGAERGREYVLNASTTATAERMIGGRLTQQRALAMVTNNLNIGNSTIGQSRRTVRNNQRALIEGILSL